MIKRYEFKKGFASWWQQESSQYLELCSEAMSHLFYGLKMLPHDSEITLVITDKRPRGNDYFVIAITEYGVTIEDMANPPHIPYSAAQELRKWAPGHTLYLWCEI